jgi:hypothetical protein
MSMNQVYDGPIRSMDVNVGRSTVKSGDPVVVGGFVGVAETDSDGGVADGRYPVPLGGGTSWAGRYQAVNHCTIRLRGGFRVPVVFTATQPTEGQPIYITSAVPPVLNTVASGNTLFGYYHDTIVPNGSAGTYNVIVILAGPVG